MQEKAKYYSVIFYFKLISSLAFFFFPLYFLKIGFNGWQSGVLMGTLTITGLIFSFIVGIKSDQLSQKKLLTVGVILFAIFSMGIGFFDLFWLILFFFFVGGLGIVLIQRVTDTLIYKATERKGYEMGKLINFKTLPFAIGLIIGAIIIERYGYQFMFLISGLGILLTIFIIHSFKETSLFKFPTIDYLNDFKNKKVIAFCLVIFVYCLHFGAEQVAYSPFLKQNLGLSLLEISFFMSVSILFLLLSGIVAGRYIDNEFSKIKLLTWSMLISGLGFLMFVLTENAVISLLWRMFHELGDGIFLVTMSVGMLDLFDRKRIGGNSGLINSVIVLATFVGSLIFGPLGYRFGYEVPHIVSGIMMIVAFVMMLILKKKTT